MKTFLDKLKSETTPERVIVRIIMAWILTSICFFIKSDGNFATALYADRINLAMYICYIVLFFMSFCALGFFKAFTWVETFGPTILISVYGILSVQADTGISYIIGLMIILGVSIVYAINKTRVFIDIKKKTFVVIIYVLAALFYLMIVGGTSVVRHLSYNSGNDGLGGITQMFHNMRDSFTPFTTLNIGKNVSYFLTEFSPIYFLFLPAYCIFPYPVTLLILQAVTVISGIIPLYLICKKLNLSKTATVSFGIIYALYPALACGCYMDINAGCFLVPLLLWLFYSIEKDNFKMVIAVAALTLLVRGDAAVYVVSIGLFLMLSKKKYLNGVILIGGSIVYYIVMVFIMKRFGNVGMSSAFSDYIVEGEGTLLDLIRTFIVNPGYAVQRCFSQEKLHYMLFMFLPVGFMPVFSKKISKLILLLPMVLVNLAPDYTVEYMAFYQYAFGVAAILIYMAVSNYGEMEERSKRTLCAVAICASVVFLPTGTLSKTGYFREYFDNRELYKELDAAIRDIPKDASVVASPLIVPHAADRSEVYEYPSKKAADVIVLDLRKNRY
ncbi:MAG: DUF2079 domain-containing protein, partial [Butyrivibrio sp.]